MALPELSRGRHSSTILSSFAFVGCGAREANCSANGNRWMNKRDSGWSHVRTGVWDVFLLGVMHIFVTNGHR